jgi:hypothetical protein
MKDDTKSLLTNRFQKTYNAREVDARLRILNEKRTSLMTTNPEKFLIVNIFPDSKYPGGGYKVDDKITIKVEKETTFGVEATVIKVGPAGDIKALKWDKEVVYTENPESKRIDDFEIGHPDVDDDLVSWTTTKVTGSGLGAKVFIISRYFPGDTPGYGDLGRAVIDDPLVQESRLTGYVTEQLRNIEALHFIGYISEVAPVLFGSPGSTVTAAESTNSSNLYYGIPVGTNHYNSVMLQEGDLWLNKYWVPTTPTKPSVTDPAPNDTSVTRPETGAPLEAFSTEWKFVTDIKRWNGTEWLSTIPEQSKYFGKTYYTPDKLDLWSNLNIIKWDLLETNSKVSSPNFLIQNTGFYWFNGWRLFNFSVDEAQFVHKDYSETITGWKVFTNHIDVPYLETQLDKITRSDLPGHKGTDAHDGKEVGTGNHYATRAQVINSALLKSGLNDGAKQLVNGKTTFIDNFSLGPYNSNVTGIDTDISDPQVHDAEYYSLGIASKETDASGKAREDTINSNAQKKALWEAAGSILPAPSYTPVPTAYVGPVFSLGTGETSFIISAKTKTNFKNKVIISTAEETGQFSTTNALSPRSGALVVYGGIGVTQDVYVSGKVTMNAIVLKDVTNSVYLYAPGNALGKPEYTVIPEQNGALVILGGIDVAERVIIRGDNDSKGQVPGKEQSYQTGALIIEGGIGVAKSINTNGPIIIDVYANTIEDTNVTVTPYTTNRHNRIYNNYNTGLRINGPGAIIAFGGSIESQTGTSTNQFNIIRMSTGVGTGFNDKGTAADNSQIYFPNDNSNPSINNTKIPNLIFRENNTSTEESTASFSLYGGSGYLDSGSAAKNGAQEYNIDTSKNPNTYKTPTTQKRTLISQGTFVVPGIQVNNRGMITKMVTTEITIPGNAGTVGTGFDADNYSGFVRLGVAAPPAPNDYNGSAGTFSSYRVALHDHKHPAGLAKWANMLQAFTGGAFDGTGSHYVKAIRSTGWNTRLYMSYDGGAENQNSVYVYYADQSGNADTVDGFHANQNPSDANTIVVRNSSGYLMTGYINSNTGDETAQPRYLIYDNGDGYYRKTRPDGISIGKASYADSAGVAGSLTTSAHWPSGSPAANGWLLESQHLNDDYLRLRRHVPGVIMDDNVACGYANSAGSTGSVDGSVTVRAANTTDNSHGLYFTGNTFRGYIGFNSSGNFNVWNSGGTSMFTCNTDGTLNATIFNGASSRTVKKNIKPFKGSALDVIKSIDVVSFKYKGDTEPQVGFIAEDTDPLLSGEEQKSMKINTTIGILIKAIQELEEKISKMAKPK